MQHTRNSQTNGLSHLIPSHPISPSLNCCLLTSSQSPLPYQVSPTLLYRTMSVGRSRITVSSATIPPAQLPSAKPTQAPSAIRPRSGQKDGMMTSITHSRGCQMGRATNGKRTGGREIGWRMGRAPPLSMRQRYIVLFSDADSFWVWPGSFGPFHTLGSERGRFHIKCCGIQVVPQCGRQAGSGL